MAQFSWNPHAPPRLSAEERSRLDAMTDAEITAAAIEDADNPPLTKAELARLQSARIVKSIRQRSGLSQAAFAKTYRINVARLRDLEQGRTQADSAILAYLKVIENDPQAVLSALSA